MAKRLQIERSISVGADDLLSIPCDKNLYEGETISSVVPAVEQSTSNITFGTGAVNTVAYRYASEGESRYCAIGEGFEYPIVCSVAGTYWVEVDALTSRGRDMKYQVKVVFKEDSE